MSESRIVPARGVGQMAEGLSKAEIGRYGRQLILPEWGVEGQLAVRSTSVLVVGMGGLGCPAALYLTAAGIGHLGLLDYDEVELNNLHRQILHTEHRVGAPKADSAKEALLSLNSHTQCTTHHVLLNSQNALDILGNYDIMVDATDNVATRYLLNDACVLLGKPLVSGSALRFEGQLTVYNHGGGPCYRCIFPTPPPPLTVTNCSEGGVLGVVPGVIGNMQALEVLKIATKMGSSYSQKLLLFDALEGQFRTIKLRPRQPSCAVCGDSPTVTELQDYELFCQSRANDKEKTLQLLAADERISCSEYKTVMAAGTQHLLLDVREPVEYHICSLRHSKNIPLRTLQDDPDSLSQVREWVHKKAALTQEQKFAVYVICRRGNDSQVAAKLLEDFFQRPSSQPAASNLSQPTSYSHLTSSNLSQPAVTVSGLTQTVTVSIKDIRGGLTAWASEVDPLFPTY